MEATGSTAKGKYKLPGDWGRAEPAQRSRGGVGHQLQEYEKCAVIRKGEGAEGMKYEGAREEVL